MDWECVYRRYRELEDAWAPGGEHTALGAFDPGYRNQQVYRRTFDPDPNRSARLARPPGIDEEVWDELGDLNRELQPLLDDEYDRGATGISVENPCDDVYHAAVMMLRQPDAYKTEPGRFYYRGQNYPWRLIPGAIRGHSDAEIKEAVKRVRNFALAFRREFGVNASDEQVASIAQHYIGGTWYLDFSANPFTALFFATDPPKSGHCGVVHTVDVREWDDWSCAGTNALGALERITVDEALRVRNQDWSSLRTPHPTLMSISFLRSIYFTQKPGFVFRDPRRQPPVTHAYIYPPSWNDQYRAFAEHWEGVRTRGDGESEAAPALSGEPDPDVLRLPTPELLSRLARGRLEQLRVEDPGRSVRGSSLDAKVERSVERLAEIWAFGLDRGRPPQLSLFHLMSNIRSLADGDVSLEHLIEVLAHSVSSADPQLGAALQGLADSSNLRGAQHAIS